MDEFLAYIKRMSGHDALWQVRYTSLGPKTVAQVKKILGMLLPVRGDPAAHAAGVNHTLSDMNSPWRVVATDGGFTIGGNLKGERVEVAHLSSS